VWALAVLLLANGSGLNDVGEKAQVGLVQTRSGEVVGITLNNAASKTRAGDLTVEEVAVSGECTTGRKDTVRLETIFVNGKLNGVDGAVRVSVDLRNVSDTRENDCTEAQSDNGGDDAEHDLEAGGSTAEEATEAEGSLAVVTNGEGGVTHDNYFRRGELRLFLCPVDYSLHTQMDQCNSETRNFSVF
jgi:hypothetical protein